MQIVSYSSGREKEQSGGNNNHESTLEVMGPGNCQEAS